MASFRQAPRSEVIEQIDVVDKVYVRLAMTRNDAGRLVVRSLLVDVFPQVWLDNPRDILASWLSTPFRYEYDQAGAVLLSEFVRSKDIHEWLSEGEARLAGFDTRPGYGSRVLTFDMPAMHDEVTALPVHSYAHDGFIPVPWPHTLYTFSFKDSTNRYRNADNDTLVAPDAEYYENFFEARAELVHGVSDSSQISRFQDGVAVRIVHADAWLSEIRVSEDTLTATVQGLNLFGCQVRLSGSREVRRLSETVPPAGGNVTLPIPRMLPQRLVIALTRGQNELDRADYMPGHPPGPPNSGLPGYSPTSQQVIVERVEATVPSTATTQPAVMELDDLGEWTTDPVLPETIPSPVPNEASEDTPDTAVLPEAALSDTTVDVHPKVFISYSHDSANHGRRVLALADRLRDDGVDCSIDEYLESPPQGWPQWMLDQIDWADYILVVCTQTYTRRFHGKEVPGQGLGATWEGAILTLQLYNQAPKNTTIIPVVFIAEDIVNIPNVLSGQTRYNLSEGPEYTKLYRRLTNQPRVVKPPLGKIKRLSPDDDE